MKAAILKAPDLLELDDLPDPLCPEGGALLEISACAVCGTDVKMREQGHRDLAYPCVLGHEMVGRIVEIDGGSCRAKDDLMKRGLAEGSASSPGPLRETIKRESTNALFNTNITPPPRRWLPLAA